MPQKCPQCKNLIPAGSDICQHCGYKPKLVERQINQVTETSGINVLKFIFIGAFVIVFIGIVVAFLVEGNITVTVINPEKSSIEFSCVKSTDCQVPMEYAVQSNCPYQAFCHDYQCVVGCPMWQHAADMNLNISYQVKCVKDSDCDCSIWDTANKYECKCLDKQCVSMVEKIK